MKSTTLFLMALISITLFTFTGCKKDNQDDPEFETGFLSAPSIEGRWQIVKSDYKETMNGQTTTRSNAAPDGSFVEFKGDGAFIGKTTDIISGRWVINRERLHIHGGGTFESSDDGYEIKKLTRSELIIYSKDVSSSSSSEETVYLKK